MSTLEMRMYWRSKIFCATIFISGFLCKILMDEIYWVSGSSNVRMSIVDKLSNRPKYWNYTKILQDLDLLDSKNLVMDKSKLSINDLKIVTVFSLNHVHQAIRSCISIRGHKELSKTSIIAYVFDDVRNDSILIFKSLCSRVEIRNLKLEKYPDYVSIPKEYRYKHILTSDALVKEKLILYVDASILFRYNPKHTFKELINNFLTKNTIDAGLFLSSRHSNFAVTHPTMIKYFNCDSEKLKNSEQYMSGIILWVGTPKAKKFLHDLVLCSLEKECMAPTGSIVKCDGKKLYGKTNWRKYADCHRFDQSALNLVLLNFTNYNPKLYIYENLYFNVERIKWLE